jgi:asparaginyl-tRNA synthetase
MQTYPIQKKYHSPDFLRTVPHLRLRTPFNSLLARFRSESTFYAGKVLHDADFAQVQPPLITSSDCEGAGEVFKVAPRDAAVTEGAENDEFFRSPKYLTVSSQLHLEAYAAELGNVWTLSPTFRAERSDTPRHLSEFYMLEVEMNFVQKLETLTEFVEWFMREWTRQMYDTPAARELLSAKRQPEEQDVDLGQRWHGLMKDTKWPRITYTDAMSILQNAAGSNSAIFKFPPVWHAGLQLEHEKFLVDAVGKGSPVFVTDYPRAVKPFYMAPSLATGTSGDSVGQFQQAAPGRETVACFDLLLPEICEVVGGSIREHRLSPLLNNMREHGLLKGKSPTLEGSSLEDESAYPYLESGEDLGSLRWYADFRRWGSAPHGGFGLGFDRFLGYLSGVASLRDVVPFPRHFGRADC